MPFPATQCVNLLSIETLILENKGPFFVYTSLRISPFLRSSFVHSSLHSVFDNVNCYGIHGKTDECSNRLSLDSTDKLFLFPMLQ